jgi:DNA-directed RNA polymerase specialized sigma24 family protein
MGRIICKSRFVVNESIMTPSEPPRTWQDRQHHLVVQAHVTAFAELCEAALPHLAYFLRGQFPQFEHDLHDIVAADVLLAYQQRPRQYDPEQLSLFAYLRMAARRDFLNAIDAKTRQEQRLFAIDDPAIQLQLQGDKSPEEALLSDAWLQEFTDLSREELLADFNQTLPETDRQIFALMLSGVRATEPYAALMGLKHLNVQTQRHEVKQAKDRLMHRLKRFSQKISNQF